MTYHRDDIIETARRAIGEDPKRRDETLNIIRSWIAQQPHYSSLPIEEADAFILFFARGCKYSLQSIKSKIDSYLSMRTALPEFFSGWQPFKAELQAALSVGAFLPLLEYDDLCRKVIVLRPCAFDPFEHSPGDVEKANFMVSEVMSLLDETMFITGMVLIVDLHGYTVSHLTQRSLPMLKKYMRFNQALPVQPKSVNFIRMPRSFSTTYSLISGFASEKIKKRFKVHSSPDFASLYQQVPRKILPKDYGGDGPSLSELTRHWKQQVEENQYVLSKMEELVRTDESKRPGKAKTSQELFGIEGSFRKLDID